MRKREKSITNKGLNAEKIKIQIRKKEKLNDKEKNDYTCIATRSITSDTD